MILLTSSTINWFCNTSYSCRLININFLLHWDRKHSYLLPRLNHYTPWPPWYTAQTSTTYRDLEILSFSKTTKFLTLGMGKKLLFFCSSNKLQPTWHFIANVGSTARVWLGWLMHCIYGTVGHAICWSYWPTCSSGTLFDTTDMSALSSPLDEATIYKRSLYTCEHCEQDKKF